MAQHHFVVYFDTDTREWAVEGGAVPEYGRPVWDGSVWRAVADADYALDDELHNDLLGALDNISRREPVPA